MRGLIVVLILLFASENVTQAQEQNGSGRKQAHAVRVANGSVRLGGPVRGGGLPSPTLFRRSRCKAPLPAKQWKCGSSTMTAQSMSEPACIAIIPTPSRGR